MASTAQRALQFAAISLLSTAVRNQLGGDFYNFSKPLMSSVPASLPAPGIENAVATLFSNGSRSRRFARSRLFKGKGRGFRFGRSYGSRRRGFSFRRRYRRRRWRRSWW